MTWVNDAWVEIKPAPKKGVSVTATRVTPSDRPLIVFQDGAMETAYDHNTAVLQLLHILAEERDSIRRWLELESRFGVLSTLATLRISRLPIPEAAAPDKADCLI